MPTSLSFALFMPFDLEVSLTGWGLLGLGLGWLLLGFLPLAGLCYLVYYLLSLPLRRQERARFFLDLLEKGLNKGMNIERTLIGISQSREHSVGVRFHLLAAHLEKGMRLIEALEQVPRLLPPQIMAMLRVGEKTGNLGKILPVCRQLLKDGTSRTTGAINYLMILAFGTTPVTLFVFGMIAIVVRPRFYEIMGELGVPIPGFAQTLLSSGSLLMVPLALVALLIYVAALAYVGGPRLTSWVKAGSTSLGDWLSFRLPWRLNRLKRDFSAVLALLLDAEVPETQAVTLAAEASANSIFIRRAAAVANDLRSGIKLSEAVRHLDDSGEFRWRLANASQVHGDFSKTLDGWHQALDAKAFQEEQASAQLCTSGVVLFNGLLVGLIVTGVFQLFTAIIHEGVLW